jgi:hypothetical protein
MLRQLRFGRGLDNRKLKAAGYGYRYTTREAVQEYREAQRVAAVKRGSEQPYRYEREVEEFLRRSPSVRRRASGDPAHESGGVAGVSSYDELKADEVAAIVPSLDPGDLEELRRYEAGHRGRTTVLGAIDRALERSGSGG